VDALGVVEGDVVEVHLAGELAHLDVGDLGMLLLDPLEGTVVVPGHKGLLQVVIGDRGKSLLGGRSGRSAYRTGIRGKYDLPHVVMQLPVCLNRPQYVGFRPQRFVA
jgi:hypothetical protein